MENQEANIASRLLRAKQADRRRELNQFKEGQNRANIIASQIASQAGAAGTDRESEKGSRTVGRSVGAVVKGNPASAAMRGFSLGMSLRQRAKENRFDGSTFYTVLFLSAIKDFVDFVTLGTVGALINIFITTALIIFFLGKRSIGKRLLLYFIGPMIVEMIPFISIFPTYTVATIMFKLKADKMQHQLVGEAEDVEREAKWQKRQAAKLEALAYNN